VSPVGQPQAPPAQTCPVGQAAPQAPQLSGSVARLTQVWLGAVPQTVPGAAQVQAEAWQSKPPVQALPQVPQLRTFVATSTQVAGVPQAVTVAGVVSQAHAPPPHVPRPQAWLQVPQLCESVARFTQTTAPPVPRHSVCPPGHAQAPLAQEAPAMHETPQLPQWRASVSGSTHAPPQAICPDAQSGEEDEVHEVAAATAATAAAAAAARRNRVPASVFMLPPRRPAARATFLARCGPQPS
jgi:hypothetical protein